MPLFGEKRIVKWKGLFNSRCVNEQKAEPEIGYEEEENVVVKRPKSKYLPGERLLKKINKEKKKNINLKQIEREIQKIMNEF
jgi:hypothetical protein